MKLESLDPKMRTLLMCIPKRNEAVEWVEEGEKVVLIYPKNFTRFERFLYKRIGGPDVIRRPMDDMGTYIWKMCDGEHNVHEICRATYSEFKEDIEPVLTRVWGFLETLLKLNLITIEKPEKGKKGKDWENKDENRSAKAKKSNNKQKKIKKDRFKGDVDAKKEGKSA